MVAEVPPQYPSDWPDRAVADKLGIGSAETLRKWVRQAEIDGGTRPGMSSEESGELCKLRAEVRKLRRANDPQGGVGFLRVSLTRRTAQFGIAGSFMGASRSGAAYLSREYGWERPVAGAAEPAGWRAGRPHDCGLLSSWPDPPPGTGEHPVHAGMID
jgi:transposase